MFVIKEITVEKLCWVNENQVKIVGRDRLTWKLKSKFQVARSAEQVRKFLFSPDMPQEKMKNFGPTRIKSSVVPILC